MVTNPYTNTNVRIRLTMPSDQRERMPKWEIKEAVREVVRALNTYAYTNS